MALCVGVRTSVAVLLHGQPPLDPILELAEIAAPGDHLTVDLAPPGVVPVVDIVVYGALVAEVADPGAELVGPSNRRPFAM